MTYAKLALVALCLVVLGTGCASGAPPEERGAVAPRGLLARATGSCEGHCGGQSDEGCWCDDACTGYGDCCPDKQRLCDAPDPCTGVVCNQPPAAVCVGSVQRTYQSIGTCAAGTCTYASTDVTCLAGCQDGACITPTSCDQIDCHHGTCDETGTPHCVCAEGYAGLDCTACASGYHHEGDLCVKTNGKDWTFIVFLNGDNNLDSYGTLNLNQMKQVGSTDNVDIVVLHDSYATNKARKLHITKGGETVVEDLGSLDLSDWRVLGEFGAWAVQNYPARNYALVLWDHGAGWELVPSSPLKGFSNDDHGTAGEIKISNGDYARALAMITEAAGVKLALVGFDACLMAMWEVAEATAPYAHAFVASEETEPGAGWVYDQLLGPLAATPDMDPISFGGAIVDAYATVSGNSTMSTIDLDTMSALDTTLSVFADALRAHPELYATVNTARSQTQAFYFSEFKDLRDFATRVKAMPGATADITAAADGLVAQLDVTIARNHHESDYPGANGLSIYFPGKGATIDPDYTAAGAVWSTNATWAQFLQSFK